MKKLIFFFCMLLVSSSLVAQQKQAEGLFLKSKAPDFKGTDQNGTKIRLKDIWKKGDVVLLFYRGQWCPYCNRQLKQLQDSLSFITAKGATVIAVTPEKPENIKKTISKTNVGFSIVHDEGLKIMKSYDVAFTVDEKTVGRYKGGGIDLNEVNGSNGPTLPVPAVYIIDNGGFIKYRFFENDYKKRPTVKELLDNLQ
jgi:peroxiredoxin